MSHSASAADLDDPSACLAPGRFIDSDHPAVIAYARRAVGDARDEAEKARRLFLAVRDDLRYDPFLVDHRPESFTASRTLERRVGFCTAKAVVLAAAARAEGIAARLAFADVRNHLTSPRLRKLMDTDLFVFHGFAELHLGGKWLKATPAFNLSLCEKAGILPLEFDGENDSIYHPFDLEGRRHMEYVRYRGSYADIPFTEMMRCFAEAYDMNAAHLALAAEGDGARTFEREVEA